MDTGIIRATEDEALQFHAGGRPGKLSIAPTKPLTTQRDLALAYSPGVAFPCLHIERQPGAAFDYTSKGNFVAVISNGTAAPPCAPEMWTDWAITSMRRFMRRKPRRCTRSPTSGAKASS